MTRTRVCGDSTAIPFTFKCNLPNTKAKKP